MSSLNHVRRRRMLSYGLSFIAIAALVLPALLIEEGSLLSQPAYIAGLAFFILVGAYGLHHYVVGPAVFIPANVRAGYFRRLFDRLVPKRAPVFRMKPGSNSAQVQVQQYLWSGWCDVHRDQHFETMSQMQLYVRGSVALAQPFIGPEFIGDDLLVLDAGETPKPVSLRLTSRYSDGARAEAKRALIELACRKFIYGCAGLAAAAGAIATMIIARDYSIGGVSLHGSDKQIAVAGGMILALAVWLSMRYATNHTRMRWWARVKMGNRAVRYRVIREANDVSYYVQVFSTSEWRTKSHLNSDDLSTVEHQLAKDVRQLNQVIATNQTRAAALAARQRLLAPFAVTTPMPEALDSEAMSQRLTRIPSDEDINSSEMPTDKNNGARDTDTEREAKSLRDTHDNEPVLSNPKIRRVEFGHSPSANVS